MVYDKEKRSSESIEQSKTLSHTTLGKQIENIRTIVYDHTRAKRCEDLGL